MGENQFILSQKVTGKERKAIARIIGEVLEQQAHYAGTPSFSYEAGGWQVDRKGWLVSPELTEERREDINKLFMALNSHDVKSEGRLTISVSKAAFSQQSIDNLNSLLRTKETLILKAFDAQDLLPIKETKEYIIFDFYPATVDSDEVMAYIEFSLKLSVLARKLKRVNKGKAKVVNEKYAFRCFLLRLGFIGDEYKIQRKKLLSRLSGSSAFRNPKGTSEEVSKNGKE